MKRLFTFCLLAVFLTVSYSAQTNYASWDGKTVPPLRGRVNDYADIFTPSEEQQLDELSAAIEEKTTAQVVVVAINTLNDHAIEDYGLTLGREWGIGYSDVNNGLLIIFALKDREMRIEVGYGLEGVITDIYAGRILDYVMKPNFRNNDYFEGVYRAMESIEAALTGDEAAMASYSSSGALTGSMREPDKNLTNIGLFMLIPWFVVGFIAAYTFLNTPAKKKKKKKTEFWIYGLPITFVLGTAATLLIANDSFLFYHTVQGIFISMGFSLMGFIILLFAAAFFSPGSGSSSSSGSSRSYRSSSYTSSGSSYSSSSGSSFSGSGGSFGGGGASSSW